MTGTIEKPKHGGGIVELAGVAANQHAVVVAKATGKIMVAERP